MSEHSDKPTKAENEATAKFLKQLHLFLEPLILTEVEHAFRLGFRAGRASEMKKAPKEKRR